MWRELDKKPRPKRTLRPYASINPRGEIVLNPTVYAVLNGLVYASIRYDERSGTIVIARPTIKGHIYRIRKFGRKGRLRVIRARRLMTHLGIRIPKTYIFTDIRHTRNPDSVTLNLLGPSGSDGEQH